MSANKIVTKRLRNRSISSTVGYRPADPSFIEPLEARQLLSAVAQHANTSARSAALVAADGIELEINTVTGDVQLSGNDAANITGISLTSTGHGLLANASFTSAFDNAFSSTAPNNSDSSIVSFNTTPQSINGLLDMGDVYNTQLNTQDIVFQFGQTNVDRGGAQTGTVVYNSNSTVTTPAPVAASPGSGTTPYPVLSTLTPTFQWDAVTGVSGLTGYQINLYNQTTSQLTTYQVGATTTSYTLSTGVLTASDTYAWNVRAVIGSATGTESNYLYFQAPAAVILPAPVATGQGSTTTPASPLNTSAPTFQWDAVSGVTGLTGYQINLENVTLNEAYTYQGGPSVTSDTAPSTVLVAGDEYVWNVRVLTGSESGPPSDDLYFQVPAAVSLPAPAATGQGSASSPGTVLDTSTPTFQWDAASGVSGLTGYQINLENLTLKKGYTYLVSATVTSYTAPSSVLTSGDDYAWNVRILVGSQSGPPSDYMYFVVPSAKITAEINADTEEMARLGVMQRATQRDMAAVGSHTPAYQTLSQELTAIEKLQRAVRRALSVLES